MPDTHRVLIIGGGFAGLYAAKALRNTNVHVTLVDRRNFHLFQPLLYQVATGGLSPANIASPLRYILSRQSNARVVLGEVVGIDPQQRRARLKDGALPYDTLIVAAGATNNYFGNQHWQKHAPGLKTIEDATEIRRRLLLAFEAAEREADPQCRAAWLTFVVVGGGPTGVELAGAIAEIARDTLRNDFRRINPADAKILLIDAAPRILPTYPQSLSRKATQSLQQLGVTVRTNCPVTDIAAQAITFKTPNDEPERIDTHTILWAAGVQPSTLATELKTAANAHTDHAGRVIVTPHLTLPDHPEIFVIGDLAHAADENGQPLPGIAPVAMQQGRYAAQSIQNRLANRPINPPFHYHHRGSMATIGRAAAVADLGRIRFAGYPAWLAWLFVHLIFLIEFQNRILVLIQWAWNYLTHNRSARLITGPNPLPNLCKPAESDDTEKPQH